MERRASWYSFLFSVAGPPRWVTGVFAAATVVWSWVNARVEDGWELDGFGSFSIRRARVSRCCAIASQVSLRKRVWRMRLRRGSIRLLHSSLRHACGWQLGLWPHDRRCRPVCHVDRKVASGDRLRTAALTSVPYILRTSNVHGFLLGIVKDAPLPSPSNLQRLFHTRPRSTTLCSCHMHRIN